eukprot:2631689-Prymnesium_polylepis.1
MASRFLRNFALRHQPVVGEMRLSSWRLVVVLLGSASALQGMHTALQSLHTAPRSSSPACSRSGDIELKAPSPPPKKGGFGFDLYPPPPPPGGAPTAKPLFADFQKNQASMYGDLTSKAGLSKKSAKKAPKKAASAKKGADDAAAGPDLAPVLAAFGALAIAAI